MRVKVEVLPPSVQKWRSRAVAIRHYPEARTVMSRPIHMTYEQERRARRSLLERWNAARERYDAEHRDEPQQKDLRDTDPDALVADPTTAHVLGALAHSEARELESIVHALRRLRSGVYGRCIVCGDSIAAAALEAAPEAVTCQGCAGDRSSNTGPTHRG
jgi:DnaK suppressor protein